VVVVSGCSIPGLFSRGSRDVLFIDKGEIVRDKDGNPLVGKISWDAKNVYPANLKAIIHPTAGPDGAGADQVDVHPPPPPTTLSLLLALACAIGAGVCLYAGKPALALPLVGAGAFVAAVPYVMPALVPVAPWIAIGGAVAWTAILGYGYLRRAQGAAQVEAARDSVAVRSFGKAVAEGDMESAVRAIRDAWPEANIQVMTAKAAGVKPPKGKG